MPKLGTTGGTVMLRALYAGVFFAMSFASTATADKCLLRSDATGAIETDEEPATFEATSDSRSAREDCGKSSSLLDTYEARSATIRVNIGKGNFVFSPLALYDKNRRVKCNKIKVRTACTRLGDE